MKMNLKELRKLPFRQFDKKTTYYSIVVIPSGRKHDSGFALMYVIGLDEYNKPIEIAAACDDIQWQIPEKTSYEFRSDMYPKSGAIHFWSAKYSFEVGVSLSSTEISLKPFYEV